MVDTNEFTKPVRGEVRRGVIRRRRWTEEEKGLVVAEAVRPGAVIAEVARRYDLTPQHLSNWIRAAREGRLVLPARDETVFVPVVVAEDAMSGTARVPEPVAQIEIVAGAFVVRVPAGADARTLEAVIRAIRRAAA